VLTIDETKMTMLQDTGVNSKQDLTKTRKEKRANNGEMVYENSEKTKM